MNANTFSTTLQRDDQEISIEVEYSYSKAYPGSRDRYGCPEEPDEPADVEIIRAIDDDGKEIELSDSEISTLSEEAMEDANQQIESAEEDAAEARYEDRRLFAND